MALPSRHDGDIYMRQHVRACPPSLTLSRHGVAFNLMQRQKPFLSLYVSGLQVYVHLYDDLSAGATVEVGGFGARNTMAPYQNPASKEYAWAEVITPIVHEAIRHLL